MGIWVFFPDSPDVLYSVYITSVEDSLSWFMIFAPGCGPLFKGCHVC